MDKNLLTTWYVPGTVLGSVSQWEKTCCGCVKALYSAGSDSWCFEHLGTWHCAGSSISFVVRELTQRRENPIDA